MNNKALIISLAVTTGIIHLILGVRVPDSLLLLNGVGYFALLATLYFIPQLAQYRKIAGYALAGYAGITIIAYFGLWKIDGFKDITGMFTKIVEVGLIFMLLKTDSE